MISVQQALQFIEQYTQKTSNTVTISVSEALGYVLAKDVFSPIDMPPFRQSAMDGYALGSVQETTYTLVNEVKAGDTEDPEIKEGQAIRIFTGAPVPSAAKSVVIQEKVEVSNNQIILQESTVPMANIREVGEQIKKGDIALSKDTKITAAGIGYLATLGVTEIEVYKKPAIAIITTGNELIAPGQPLSYGQIYESNSLMLVSALQKSGFSEVSTYKISDNYEATQALLEKTIADHDVILISGGISVGDYDFVGKALRNIGIEEVFYKVKQKPGKPLFYGKHKNKTIFALPGNPASSLSCFYIYVLPAILKLSGYTNYHLERSKGIANTNFTKKGERAAFLKAHNDLGQITILDAQASSMLRSFALANALVYLPEDTTEVTIGDTIEIINLP